ncbi:DUF221-domain-containing protein [Venturia nashicola]|uniref:DUF221-domain-containing protein n=1 Tax=Venturia nashicola TaxID=86259 RepID=A0A4Z1PA67_9PEZI|nr:DUF221-domain-containing protein [Venturia nashicola]
MDSASATVTVTKSSLSTASASASATTSSDPVVGTHRTGPSSVWALGSTLLPMLLFASVLVFAFLVLRARHKRIYAPRTFLPTLREDEKTPSTTDGMFAWVKDFMRIPDDFVLNHQSLDQYLFLRFLKMITIMCAVGCLITWPLLLPINATGGEGESGLNAVSISNIKSPNRFYAHAIVAWLFLGFVMLMITRETIYFINLRQAFLMTPRNASRISSRTVLFTDVPDEYLNERSLRTICSSVRRIWLATDCYKLAKVVEEREDAALRLERAEVKLSQTANKERLKHRTPLSHSEGHDPQMNGSCAAKWIKHSQRPTHRLRFLGKKVDSINWTRATLPGLIEAVKTAQIAHRNGQKKYIGAVFVEFETQRAAQFAFQLTAHELPLKMQARCIGIPPQQILWQNLGMKAWQRMTKGIWATVFVAAMIIFWSIPVALVGGLSNIDYLTNKIPWLGFINRMPEAILGAVKGLLPSAFLALLVMAVPIVLRRLAAMAGAVSQQEVELRTQSWFFAFQVIQVFLVTTFSSGASAVVTQIVQYPTSAPKLLAQNLPKASNFYISYFLVFGLASSSKMLFNFMGLLRYGVGGILKRTPRQQYEHFINLSHLKWGSEYPKWTLLAVIAIAYSCIAPLVLGFATIGLGLIYLVSRYNSIYTLATTIDTKGQAYGRAMQQLTVGVYLAEISLIGLFAIKIGEGAASIGPLLLMVILLITTALFHAAMRRALHPLTRTLPSSLLTRAEESRYSSAVLEEGVIGYSYEGEIRYHSSNEGEIRYHPSNEGEIRYHSSNEGEIRYHSSNEGEIRYHSSNEGSIRDFSEKHGSIRPPSSHGDSIRPAPRDLDYGYLVPDSVENDSVIARVLNEEEETEKVKVISNNIIARSYSQRLASVEPRLPNSEKQQSSSENTMRTAEERRSLGKTEEDRRDLEIREMRISAAARASAAEDAWLRPTTTSQHHSQNNNNNRDTFQSVWSASPVPSIAPPPTGSFLNTFFRPNKFATYAHLKRKFEEGLFAQPVPMYAPEVARTAYFHPAISRQCPTLWFVRDQMGISEQEMRHSGRILRVSDKGAWFDEKGRVRWDDGDLRGAVAWERRRDVLI